MMRYKRYKDRKDAGRYLAQFLKDFQNDPNVIVLALPRGGVPIAYEIASINHLALDVFLVRKLGVPWNPELAMGAIAEQDSCYLNNDIILQLALNKSEIDQIIQNEKHELERRLIHYRHGKPLPNLKNKIIILVDDGIATGATIKASLNLLNSMEPQQIVVAVPVATKESLLEISNITHKIICPLVPDNFYGVGYWYEEFPQITDEEVINLLAAAKKNISPRKNISS